MSLRHTLLLLVGLATFGAFSLLPSSAAQAEEVSTFRFPTPPKATPPDVLTFSHALHVGENELDCSDCHDGIEKATTIAETHTPEMEVCEDCHEDEVDEKCTMCHSSGDDAEASLKPWVQDINFSHKAHLGRGATCLSCHPQAKTSAKSGDRLTPAMKTCGSCHQKQIDRLDCQGCHTNLADLKKSSSQVAVHGAGWFGLHPAWAKGSAQVCAQCHEQSFCSECHERTGPTKPSTALPAATDRTLIHRGDWIGRHPLEAASNPARCRSCHGTTFCTECHSRALGLKKGKGDFRRSPHPAGFLQRGNPAGFHGEQARREAWRCASCHDQGAASICVDCHKVGGPGGNPHPPGFKRIRAGKAKTGSGSCAPCHLVAGP